MAKNAQHQWQPKPGEADMVKCDKCGSEVKASRARRGAGPCIWGSADDSPPAPNPDQAPVPDDLSSTLNLCTTCHLDIATCDSELTFGTGEGNDNVIACDAYRAEVDEPPEAYEKSPDAEPAPPKYPGPKLTDPPEYCNGCNKQLAILPLNSRLDMVACNNHRCALYRERIRMVTKPVERGRRKRATSNGS